ncbi:hypothetical protein ACFPOI_52790 [Nonomuraea angiospora]|uniref:Uncharacterized protein n=1 Tax=Nonomuraea angiospora TaxID=46172 RepID=A0ABR9M5W7_9ACTN|nr:hypothetical protein [Nonomuraea angiospora]MBE1588279.1 hypothetical protein [Nonomuraea angiospora]
MRLVAVLGVAFRRARLAKVTAALGGAWSLSLVNIHGSYLMGASSVLLVAVPVLAALVGFHGDAPPARRPWWVALLPLTAVAMLAWAAPC